MGKFLGFHMPQFWHIENGNNNNNTHFIVLLMRLNKVSQSLIMVLACSRHVINSNTVNSSYYIEVMYNIHIIILLRCVYLHFSGNEVT